MEIIHKKGKENVVVDALSRKDEDITSYSILVTIPDWMDEIRSEYSKDPETTGASPRDQYDITFVHIGGLKLKN